MLYTKEMQKGEDEAGKDVERTRARKAYAPPVDIIEGKDEIIVMADMSGVDEKSVDVSLEKEVLTIQGRVEPHIPGGHRLIASEYGTSDYSMAFAISDEIDRDNIRATVKNGLLRLVLPKAEPVRTKKITITAAE